MKTGNKGLVAVILLGCLLGLCAGLAYLFLLAPKAKAEEARTEVLDWESKWLETRSCLLGSSNSSKVETRLAIQELSIGDARQKLVRCNRGLKALVREEGASSENQRLEEAWFALRKPVSRLAQALAWRTAKTPNKGPAKLRAALVASIEEVDARWQGLRKAAQLGPISGRTGSTPAATRVGSLWLPDDSGRVTEIDVGRSQIRYQVTGEKGLFSVHRYFSDSVHAEAGDERGKPEQTRSYQLSPLALRALEGDWGLWLEIDGIPTTATNQEGSVLVAGPLDELGEPAGDGVVLATVGPAEIISPEFAIGSGQSRVAVYYRKSHNTKTQSLTYEHVVVQSEDAGASYRPVKLPEGEMWVELSRSATTNYIAFPDSPHSLTVHWWRLGQDGLEKHVLPFAGSRYSVLEWPPELCQAPNRSYWLVNETLYSLSDSGHLSRVAGKVKTDTRRFHQYMSCSDEGFAVRSQKSGDTIVNFYSVQLCTVEECESQIYSLSVPAGADVELIYLQGAWRALVVLENVVGIYDNLASSIPSRFVTLPHGHRFARAFVSKERIGLVSFADESGAPVEWRVPAP